MKFSIEEVLQYVVEEDVTFIRLAFCDVLGKPKNISIMQSELNRAFTQGIAIDASAIVGFGDEANSDLYLHPVPETLSVLPWRPEHGKVVRMYCRISYPDGTPFECDMRRFLENAVQYAKSKGLEFLFGPEMEFYLFRLDDFGKSTGITYDEAGYMDIAPEDKGENVRREICLTLEQMGLCPECSHHEEGPGQNEIDFRYSDPLTAADNTITFRTVVKTVAGRNGLCADFSPKPIDNKPGSGFHINISATHSSGKDCTENVIAGLLKHVKEITLFLNASEQSYNRLGKEKAPSFISWSEGNRSQLIRIPITTDEKRRIELRSPDSSANPYIAFALCIYAAVEGVMNKLTPVKAVEENLFSAGVSVLNKLDKLPSDKAEAFKLAANSEFVKKYVPSAVLSAFKG